MKILAIKLRAIGDTVIWTSALAALKKARPEAEIHVLTYAGNEAVFINQEFTHKQHYLKTQSRWALIKKLLALRKEKFDWLLGFHANTSLCRWAWLAGAEKMALHHHSWQKTPGGSAPIPEPGKLENAISRDYQLLRAMGINSPQEPTRLTLSREERKKALEAVTREIAAKNGDIRLPRMVFLPGAGHHLRRYPKDLWWAKVVKVRDEKRFQPVVLADGPLSMEWNLPKDCFNMKIPLIAGASLREFMAMISTADRALANDSGPGHIAAALGVSTFFIFGPGCVGDWHCYDRQLHPIYRVPNVECRLNGPRDQEQFQFCTINECSHHKCMREIRITL